jgi:hypothetical protein
MITMKHSGFVTMQPTVGWEVTTHHSRHGKAHFERVVLIRIRINISDINVATGC